VFLNQNGGDELGSRNPGRPEKGVTTRRPRERANFIQKKGKDGRIGACGRGAKMSGAQGATKTMKGAREWQQPGSGEGLSPNPPTVRREDKAHPGTPGGAPIKNPKKKGEDS